MPWRSSDPLVKGSGQEASGSNRSQQWEQGSSIEAEVTVASNDPRGYYCTYPYRPTNTPPRRVHTDHPPAREQETSKFVLADWSECIGPKTQLLRSNRGKTAPSGAP